MTVKIIVSGMARSGTTFIGEVFNQNPLIDYLFEPFWGFSEVGRTELVQWSDEKIMTESEAIIKDVFSLRLSTLESQEPRISNWLKKRGWSGIKNDGDIVAIKDIRFNLKLRWLMKVIGPELKIINVVRDPRGIVASMLFKSPSMIPSIKNIITSPYDAARLWLDPEDLYSRWRRIEQEGKMPLIWNIANETLLQIPEKYVHYLEYMKGDIPHLAIAARWSLLTMLSLDDMNSLPEDSYITLRYEDFCHDPLKQTNNMYEFIGIDSTEQVLSWLEKHTQKGDRKVRYATARDSKSMINAWNQQLSNQMAEEVAVLCSEPMKRLGYS